MRLINVHTLELEEFWGRDPPAYGIASHTWGSEEVSFQEWKDRASISHKAGYHKIVEMAQLAMAFGLNYVWVDTNCIDKTSSAELSEAINSMFNWYAAARQCFVYFDDVASTQREEASDYNSESLQDARWFTRGWTLQELIAPGHLVFLSQNWQIIGDLSKTDTPNPRSVESKIAVDISVITGIDQEVLHVREEYKKRSIAARMHWASRRKTTRVEDMAYCLLGLFKINMPLLYGEGKTAFQRLQEEIMKVSIDQSIFAWSYETVDEDQERISLMAPWPSAFTNGTIIKTKASRAPIDSVYTMTNFGLSVQFPLLLRLPARRKFPFHSIGKMRQQP
ncbi:heterokaryon incompatibility protein-domain-containing protein [Xylaria curta]|nr:heterokaryon incompatibility protein-domain-containing protein [Xylaria curta]